MNIKTFKSIGILSIMVVLALSLVACMPATNEQADKQAANRAYMSDVNQIMDDIDKALSDFAEALADNNAVSMKTQVQKAADSVAALEKLEAPEGLNEVHEGYVAGVKKLQEALSGYVDAFVQAGNGENVEKRLKDLQKLYDEGIQALEEADKKATEQE